MCWFQIFYGEKQEPSRRKPLLPSFLFLCPKLAQNFLPTPPHLTPCKPEHAPPFYQSERNGVLEKLLGLSRCFRHKKAEEKGISLLWEWHICTRGEWPDPLSRELFNWDSECVQVEEGKGEKKRKKFPPPPRSYGHLTGINHTLFVDNWVARSHVLQTVDQLGKGK